LPAELRTPTVSTWACASHAFIVGVLVAHLILALALLLRMHSMAIG
jgi:uncharacterized membrane-anchored protein YhcB (DUF1043 family)